MTSALSVQQLPFEVPTPAHPNTPLADVESFQARIQRECLEDSAIDPALYAVAVDFVEDEGFWEPQHLLGHTINRFWESRQPHAFEALACFRQEDGSLWQAKPQNPRVDSKRDKPIKYETPKGAGSTVYRPPVTAGVWRAIARRYDCPPPAHVVVLTDAEPASGFWDWVIANPSLPIIVTEGAKKALSLLSHGFIGLSLYGVHGGYRSKDRLGNPVPPHLTDALTPFSQAGRPIRIAFDQDEKPRTRRRVTAAIFRFGGLLTQAGALVSVVRWPEEQGKGVDDLIAGQGIGAFQTALHSAYTLDEFHLALLLQHRLTGITPALTITTQDLSTTALPAIPESGIVAVSSAKGTGKTKLIAQLVTGDRPVLLLTHRVVLGRNLCERLGVDYRTDLDRHGGRFIGAEGYTARVGTVVDSLLAVSPKQFEPGTYDVVIDELVQVLRHLLTSSTCNKDGKRVAILSRFSNLIANAQRVIVADADLDRETIRYLQSLRSTPETPWLLVNNAKPQPWDVRFIEANDASVAIASLLDAVQAGARVLVATDSKTLSKKLERLIINIGKTPLLLNSETSGGEMERAFIQCPNRHLDGWDVVIATPSMATGVSIESTYFDRVYGLFQGVSATDADMAQALARVRDTVPRVIWCANHGRNFSRIAKETKPQRLKDALQDQTNTTAVLTAAGLGAIGVTALESYAWDNPHVTLWSQCAAKQNQSMLSLRSALKVRLLEEGHTLTIEQHNSHQSTVQALRSARDDIRQREAAAVANAPDITPAIARVLNQTDVLSPEERLALKKFALRSFYAVDEVTPDLVLLDNDGRYRSQLLELEKFLEPTKAVQADIHSLEKQVQWDKGLTPWDLPHATIKQKIRDRLGLRAFIDSDEEWTPQELNTLKETALQMVPHIKKALNITIKEDMAPAQIIGQLLDQLGLSTKSRQFRVKGQQGKRCRAYALDTDTKDQALTILTRRAMRSEETQNPVTPQLVNDDESTGCDTINAPVSEEFAGVEQLDLSVVSLIDSTSKPLSSHLP